MEEEKEEKKKKEEEVLTHICVNMLSKAQKIAMWKRKA